MDKKTAKKTKRVVRPSALVSAKAAAQARLKVSAKAAAQARLKVSAKAAAQARLKVSAKPAAKSKIAAQQGLREKETGQHIGYRYDVNLVPDLARLTPFLKKYLTIMGWQDLNWLEDVHLGYEEGQAAVFDRNINGWVTVPKGLKVPSNQQDRDMLARELLVKFQMSPRHPMVELNVAYRKF